MPRWRATGARQSRSTLPASKAPGAEGGVSTALRTPPIDRPLAELHAVLLRQLCCESGLDSSPLRRESGRMLVEPEGECGALRCLWGESNEGVTRAHQHGTRRPFRAPRSKGAPPFSFVNMPLHRNGSPSPAIVASQQLGSSGEGSLNRCRCSDTSLSLSDRWCVRALVRDGDLKATALGAKCRLGRIEFPRRRFPGNTVHIDKQRSADQFFRLGPGPGVPAVPWSMALLSCGPHWSAHS